MSIDIWACVKDPGGTNGVLPVVAELRKRGFDALVIANGKAPELPVVQALDRYLVVRTPDDVLGILPPARVLITSMCSKGGVGRDLVPLMRERGIHTVAGQDWWGGQLMTNWPDPRFYPDAIWVGDDQAAVIVKKAWPAFQGQTWVTGLPALDRYASLDVAATRMRVRESCDVLDGKTIVLYAGEIVGTGAVLSRIVNALNEIGHPIVLIPRQHPRMPNDAPGEFALWREACERFNAGVLLGETSALSTTDLVAAADVVIGETSTVLMEAVVLGKQVIAVLFPDGIERYRRSTGGLIEEFPLTALGCAAKATNQDELAAALRVAVTGDLGLRAAQARAFPLDGMNASRVADRVMSLL